jgi:hypothetical protein
VVICGVVWAVPWWWWQCWIFRFRGTSGSLVGRSGLLSVYSSAPGLGGTTWIEQRPWGLQSAPLVVICGVIWAVPWWWWQCRIFRFRGTSGSLVGRSGLLSVYSSTVSLGSAAGVEWRPWELESAPLVAICGVIWAVPWWWWQCQIFRFRGTSGSLMDRSGLSSVYPGTVSHGTTTGIEWRPWELQSVPLVVICGVIWAVPWW